MAETRKTDHAEDLKDKREEFRAQLAKIETEFEAAKRKIGVLAGVALEIDKHTDSCEKCGGPAKKGRGPYIDEGVLRLLAKASEGDKFKVVM